MTATETKVAVVMTCHSRKDVTLAGLTSLFAQRLPDGTSLQVILVDDGSTDGTADAVAAQFPQVRILKGDGTLWWAGAMHLGLREAAATDADFHLWLNDDVELDRTALAVLLAEKAEASASAGADAILIGPVREPGTDRASYGGQRRTGHHPLKLVPVLPNGHLQPCDTFQGNVVFVPASVTRQLGGIPDWLIGIQGMADTDFGLRASAAGVPIIVARDCIGSCALNLAPSIWRSPKLSRKERLAALTSPRGIRLGALAKLIRPHGGGIWWFWVASVWAHALIDALMPPRRSRRLQLAVLDGVVPHYRVPLFAGLAHSTDFDVTIYRGEGQPSGWFAESVPETDLPFPTLPARNRFWPLGKGRRLWTGGTLRALFGDADAVLVGLHVHELSVWAAILFRNLFGRPKVLLSGHFRLDEQSGARGGIFSSLRRFLRIRLARSGDAVLPYTEAGADACRRSGIPAERIFITRNSLDIASIRNARRNAAVETPQAFRDRLALPEGPVFLAIGRFYPAKRFDIAIEAIRTLRDSGHACSLLLIGDGPNRPQLEQIAQDQDAVRFLGNIIAEDDLAPLFAQASAVLLPGSVGLAVVHAFAYGVPVVTCPDPAHSPEAAYLETERNGLVAESLTRDAFVEALQRLLSDPGLLGRLGAGAEETGTTLSVEVAVEAIIGATTSALGAKRT